MDEILNVVVQFFKHLIASTWLKSHVHAAILAETLQCLALVTGHLQLFFCDFFSAVMLHVVSVSSRVACCMCHFQYALAT